MKILIVSQYYFPEQFQINDIAPELVRRGHEVTVLCGLPNYPKGVFFEGYGTVEECKGKDDEYYRKTGVRVVHVEQAPRGKNPFSLVRNYMSFAKSSKRKVREWAETGAERFDLVLGYQLSPITSMYAALEYKRLTGVPVVYYTLDIWPASAEAMLKSKKNPMYAWVRKISKTLYHGADKVVVTSRPFIDYLNRELGYPKERMSYLPQHADTGMINDDLTAEDNGVADFMFAGNIGKGQRVDVIVKAANLLGKRKDYKIHLVGDGRMRQELEQMVHRYGLEENVIFYGNQKREDMPKFYKMADMLLITLRGNNEVGDTIPGKLQMYMTTGKPIIGAINGGAQEVIKEAKCGSCVNAGDSKGLADLMRFVIEHPGNYSDCGGNARKYFLEHFTLDKYMDGLEAELLAVRD
ncbi:MAG: glycosyltransferase family 4 protein [Bacteroidaceae bacterium]|nr:glycosyltransferase family 4 protein [Bacteroidaceae bacterium]